MPLSFSTNHEKISLLGDGVHCRQMQGGLFQRKLPLTSPVEKWGVIERKGRGMRKSGWGWLGGGDQWERDKKETCLQSRVKCDTVLQVSSKDFWHLFSFLSKVRPKAKGRDNTESWKWTKEDNQEGKEGVERRRKEKKKGEIREGRDRRGEGRGREKR